MNGNKFFLDTNAVLYILSGDKILAELLYGEKLCVSVITEMELLSYSNITAKEKQKIQDFLSEFVIVNIDDAVKLQTIEIKKQSRLKLPDSIIAATAIVSDLPLLTSDKHYKKVKGLNLLFYEK